MFGDAICNVSPWRRLKKTDFKFVYKIETPLKYNEKN